MKTTLLNLSMISLSLLFSNSILAQTGAAGVGTSAENVIWLDAHALNLSNGTPVATFTDFSGNNNHFSQGSVSLQPVATEAGLNGLSVVTFDGVNDVLESGSIPALESSELTYFIVFQKTNLVSQMMITSQYSSSTSAKWRTYSNTNSNKVIGAHYSPTIQHVSFTDDGDASFLSHHIESSTNKIYREGNLMLTKSATYTTPSGHMAVGLGNKLTSTVSGNNYTLNGYIAEVVVYNTSLNSLQRVLIENYLGTKYNIAIPSDFYAYQATHKLDLIAIGDNGTNSQTTAQGKDIVEFSAPTSMGSGEYLMAAHTDNALTEFTMADMPASLPLHQRFTRTWRAGETGDVGTTTITFKTGSNDFANSASYRLLVDSDGDFSDATIVTGAYSSGDVSFNVDLNDGDFFTLAGIEEILEIHSHNGGGNWSDVATWDCNCIPSASDEVYIDPSTTVFVNQDAEVDYFAVENGGALVMDLDFTLNIGDGFDMDGALTCTDGTIAFVGDDLQYFDPLGNSVSLNNLTINNSAVATVDFFEGTYKIDGIVNVISGELAIEDVATNHFIIQSNGSSTGARIAPILGGASITGPVEVERFIPAGNADWRNLSSPVTDATFDAWDPDLAMSGSNFPDGCAFGPDGCFHSVRFTQNSISNNVLNSTDVIDNGRGYEVFVGTSTTTFDGTTLTSRGTVNTTTDVTRTLNTGWWTLGNPYACPITFSSITKPSQVGNYFYVYDAAAGSYQFYDGSDNSFSTAEIGANGLIETGQAFWVSVSSVCDLSFEQINKTTTEDGTFIRTQDQINDMKLVLSEDASTYYSSIALQESNIALDGLDTLGDIKHLFTGKEEGPSISMDFGLEDNVRKNYISNNFKDKSFNLLLNLKNEGYYTLSALDLFVFDHYNKILIYDKETKAFHDFKEFSEYHFYGTEGETDRFTLILSNSADNELLPQALSIESESDNILNIVQMGNIIDLQSQNITSENVEISLYNMLGQQQVYTTSTSIVNGSNIVNLPADLNGIHIFVVNINGKQYTKKLIF
ncbi:MAG: T9SS type A sorting domain-containing protein [Crocinitomicaceae bacterium]